MQAKQRIPRRHYTDDFKAQAVTLASSIGQAQAARKLGMSVKTLSHWMEAHRHGNRGATVQAGAYRSASRTASCRGYGRRSLPCGWSVKS